MPDTHDPHDPRERESAEDAAWREIVANFGERAELDPADELPARFDELTVPEDLHDPDEDVFDELLEGQGGDPADAEDEWDRFVPPEPELVGMPLDRRLAWAGVLGAPVAALIAALVLQGTSGTMPGWLGALLALSFLGGFGYLVATMPKDRDDPWDDGARL